MIVTAAVPAAANNDEISEPMAASAMEAAATAFMAAKEVATVGGAADGAELAGAEADGAAAGWEEAATWVEAGVEGSAGAGVDAEAGPAELDPVSELKYDGIAALLIAALPEACGSRARACIESRLLAAVISMSMQVV